MKHESVLLCPQDIIPVLNSDQQKPNPHPLILFFKTA
jgi:hypothetical protein